MPRVPGPLGVSDHSGNVIQTRSPLKGTRVAQAGGTLQKKPGPIGIKNQVSAKTAAKTETKSTETKNAEKELDLLRRLYGIMKDSKNKKAYFHRDKKNKKKWVYDTDAYIKYRKSFFGSTKDYENYKKEAKKDLDADKEKLRRYIDPPKTVREKHKDWKDGQEVFYAWVKKKFEKDNGTKTAYAKIIKTQKSEKLKKALATVKKDYGKSFKSGGFNPRPQKRPGGIYLLGTISEHAVGNAIDIDATKNAQISSRKWKYILAYTGKKVSTSDLKTKWKSKSTAKAKEVYDAIKAVNDEWVSKLDKSVKKLKEEEQKKAKAAAELKSVGAAGKAAGKTAGKKVDYLAKVVAGDNNLKKIGKAWVQQWKGGFLNLEWALVKELHEEGLIWGAAFSTPDLHHFEF